MIRVGTSGYSFPDWKGPVYPQGLANDEMLPFYEKELGFPAVEINYTYYRLPSAKTMQAMVDRTSPGFEFTVKFSKEMTHDIFNDDWSIKDNPDAFQQFMEGVQPLIAAERLACLLAQFPYAFIKKPATIEHLLRCKERVGAIPLVAEFRHHSWATPVTYESLRRHNIGWCVVDEPALPKLLPFVPELTSDIGYFRFHGRNMEWFKAQRDERYNYLYSGTEMQSFVPHIKNMQSSAKKVFVFFNNCHHGKAAINAKEMTALLAAVYLVL
jgi:uncharacterized protein YecE (DUF72 family)